MKQVFSLILIFFILSSLPAQEIDKEVTPENEQNITTEDNTQENINQNSDRLIEDISFYNLSLEINPENGTIEGNISIDIPWTKEMESGGSSVFIGLLLNNGEEKNPYAFSFLEEGGPDGFSPSNAAISNVTVNSINADWKYAELTRPIIIKYNTEHLVYEIILPEKPSLGEILHLEFYYKAQISHIKGMDDFYFKDKMISRFSWFPYIYTKEQLINGEFIMHFFTYKADINLTSGWEMAAIGTEFKKDNNTFSIESSTPVSSFPLIFLKNHNITEHQLIDSDCTLRIYYKGNIENAVSLITGYALEILDYYKNTFFALDYKNISIVQGNTGLWGMASDSAVIIGDALFGALDRGIPNILNPMLHYILSHELGHFYFGIGSPPDFTRENYLSEGLCEFASIKFHEMKYGIWDNLIQGNNDIASSIVKGVASSFFNSLTLRGTKYYSIVQNYRSGWDSPASEEPEEKIINSIISTDYDKAYFIIHMLFNYLGDERIDEALKYYLENNRYKQVSSETLKFSLESFYNKDLNMFFNTFIYDDKDLDYELSGSLNEQIEGRYQSILKIEDLNNTGIFIPVKLTIFYEDNSQEEQWIYSPGEIIIESTKEIDYAGIDKNISLLDFDRRNNFYPKQTYFLKTDDDWLSEFGASKWSISPYLSADEDYIFFGLGPKFREPFKWQILTAPFIGIPLSISQIMDFNFSYGAGLITGIDLPHSNRIKFHTRYIIPNEISLIELEYSKRFNIDTELGYVGHTYLPGFGLTTSVGLAEFLADEPDNPDSYLFNSFTLDLDLLEKCGYLSDVTNEINYYYSNTTFEDRISASIMQGVPFIPRTLLSFKLSGSVSMGELNNLGASNSVIGFPSTVDDYTEYSVKFKTLFGIPLVNDINLSIFNWIVLQSVNFAIVYEGACAFSNSEGIIDGMQHAIGFEIMQTFRTVGDLTIPVSFGVSFNLTDIFNNPDEGASYIPGFYISVDPAGLLFNSVASY